MDDGERIRLIFIKITENVDCQFEIILVNLFSLKESCENCWGTYILAHREFLYRMMYKTSKNNFLFEVCFVWILEDKETHLNWWLQKILPNMLSSFYCNFSFNGILSCHSFVKKIPQYDSIMISHCSRINTATDWANISFVYREYILFLDLQHYDINLISCMNVRQFLTTIFTVFITVEWKNDSLIARFFC